MMPIIPIPMVTNPKECQHCMNANMELARIAYEAYCAARNWKSVKGETLPHFHQQDPSLQEAWASAAAAVKNNLHIASSPG